MARGPSEARSDPAEIANGDPSQGNRRTSCASKSQFFDLR